MAVIQGGKYCDLCKLPVVMCICKTKSPRVRTGEGFDRKTIRETSIMEEKQEE